MEQNNVNKVFIGTVMVGIYILFLVLAYIIGNNYPPKDIVIDDFIYIIICGVFYGIYAFIFFLIMYNNFNKKTRLNCYLVSVIALIISTGSLFIAFTSILHNAKLDEMRLLIARHPNYLYFFSGIMYFEGTIMAGYFLYKKFKDKKNAKKSLNN
ncbi:MAG: hypothetical protein LBR11_10675 [Deltaproteobacteria bacterium]|nr:hypothetical protein [Deltaproteobacteria bacterium]